MIENTKSIFQSDWIHSQILFPASFASQGALNKDPMVWLKKLSLIMDLIKPQFVELGNYNF